MKPIVYIDGQNFLYKAAEVLIAAGRIEEKQDLHTFSFRLLFTKLLKDDALEIRYYGTRLRRYSEPQEIAEKSRIMLDSQRRLRNSLKSQNVAFIESGNLKLRDGDKCKHCGKQDSHFQEKGVDVRIAVDLLQSAHEGKTDSFVLVSSDTDLLPPVQYLKSLDKKVIYVGFSDKLTNALNSNASETQVIRDNEILEAFDALNPQTTLKSSPRTSKKS